jgi:hypothetical protein
MKEFDTVQVGERLVPVVGVALHYPHFVLYPPDGLERAGARIGDKAAQIIRVIF